MKLKSNTPLNLTTKERINLREQKIKKSEILEYVAGNLGELFEISEEK